MKCKQAASLSWRLLRKYVLTLRQFDLCVQGALLVVLLLEVNVYLLVRRGAGTGVVPAFLEDYMVMAAGGLEFFLAVIVSWIGRHRRNYAMAISLTITTALALLVFIFPFDETQKEPAVELCNGDTIPDYKVADGKILSETTTDPNVVPRMIVLLLTAFSCVITKLSIWAHGLTYLDDHEPQNGPYFYGILISIRLSLGMSSQGWLRPVSTTEDWWTCYLPLSLLPLMFAIFFVLFPRRMKKELQDDWASDFSESFSRVIKNKMLLTLILAIALLQLALFSISQYDLAYVQGRFHIEVFRQNPRTSRVISDIYRPFVIIFFIMIFRVRFSVRREDGVKATTAARVGGVISLFVVALLTVIAAVGCDLEDIEGGTKNYVQPACSIQCGCASDRYGFSPVCSLDSSKTYFSPCHAGCDEYEDLNGFVVFHNCTCGIQRAVRGSCSTNDCSTVYSVYQIIYTVLLAVAGSGLLMQGIAVLRSVKENDKPLAIGVSFAFIALFNDVLGRLLYLLISYASCAYATSGACVFYHSTIWMVPTTSAVLAFLSALISFSASRLDLKFMDIDR